MKLLFKITKYLPETQQIIVKCCRQNAPKPIDDYPEVALDLMHVDFTNYENLKYSLIMNLVHIVKKQIEDEPILLENEISEEIDSEDLNDYVNKIIGVVLEDIIDGKYLYTSML
jgi:predicted metal-binding transcription factor (methanogenesis marker protein 9)